MVALAMPNVSYQVEDKRLQHPRKGRNELLYIFLNEVSNILL